MEVWFFCIFPLKSIAKSLYQKLSPLRFMTQSNKINEELIALLACPVCRADLAVRGQASLVCCKCRAEFLVKDGIPVLLPPSELSP